MQWLDGWGARRSDAVVVISAGFAAFYRDRRGVDIGQIRVIPNWMDESAVVPMPRDGRFRERLGFGAGDFVGMYAGNIGEVAGVRALVEAASLLTDVPAVRMAVVGDGVCREECEALARGLALGNVVFHHPWRDETVSEVHAAADVLVLTTHGASARTSVPSKLAAYMLSGRPVLAAVDRCSEVAAVVRSSGCGLAVPPDDPAALAAAMRSLWSRPDRLAEMGRRSREWAEARYSARVCVPRLSAIIEAVGARRPLPTDPAMAGPDAAG